MEAIPEDEGVLKRQETVRPKKTDLKEEFADAEVANLVGKANDMEAKAENGLILEVNTRESHTAEHTHVPWTFIILIHSLAGWMENYKLLLVKHDYNILCFSG